MPRTTLRLDTRRMLHDGTYPIKIVVGHGTDIYLQTGIYATKDEWDERTLLYIGKGGTRVNAALSAMLTMVINRIMELKESGIWPRLTRKQIREMLTNLDIDKPTTDTMTITDVFAAMGKGKSENTQRTAKFVSAKIQAFGYDPTKLHLDQITPGWIDDFYASMSSMAVNSKALYMKTLKHAFNWAIAHDITTNNPFRRFHIKMEETRMRDLPIEKMRQIKDLSLPKQYAEYRDMFLLTFYLIGINTVDLADCTTDSIVNGRLEYRRHKTKKLYSIKIEPEAMKIIRRYKGKNHLLRCFDRCTDYRAMLENINHALARIGPFDPDGNHRTEMIPIENKLSLYWARYSWATYAAELDIPKDTISEALGHSHGAKVTGVYIKYNRDKVDAANRMVIDYMLKK